MTTNEAVLHFKTQRGLADALAGCSQAAVAQWGEFPPLLRQLEIERLTGGDLRAESACDKYRVEAA